MEDEGLSKQGSQSQDSEEPALPGSSFRGHEPGVTKIVMPPSGSPGLVGPRPTTRGVESARKMLRSFCIQKKTPVSPVSVAATPKLSCTSSSTVLIGKLSSVKPMVKPDKVPDAEKIPKPPKPGQLRKAALESYEEQQKRMQAEIEHMKRKMEMVELGIPLGLLCPGDSHRAMPTKAMPPIKTFLDIEKVDEIILEAKKAKAEGREFKFDYNKFVPDYTNPFQRKREEDIEKESLEKKIDRDVFRRRERDKRSSSRFDRRFDRDVRKEDKSRHRDMERAKSRDSNASRDKDDEKDISKGQETKVNLNDYLVCDSWSLENDDKASISSPHVEDKQHKATATKEIAIDIPAQQLKDNLAKTKSPSDPHKELTKKTDQVDSPDTKPPVIEKLKPVMDSFKFEIDPDDDEDILDIFDENTDLQKYTKVTNKKDSYDAPVTIKLEPNPDETFLESVIEDIKHDSMSVEDDSQDKSLVGYDTPKSKGQGSVSVTPEHDASFRDSNSQRSNYSDGRRSTESRKSVESFKSSDTGYKSSDTGYRSIDTDNKTPESSHKSRDSRSKLSESSSKSIESGQNYCKTEENIRRVKVNRRDVSVSSEKELGELRTESALGNEMSKCTVDSLERWSFVLKICQPLLFRHDRNKCYKETRTLPKLWYTENPKLCTCVKDRSVVYEELEMCKCSLIDKVYESDQMSEPLIATTRAWYPPEQDCLIETVSPQPLLPESIPLPDEMPPAGIEPATCEWETEDNAKTLTPEKKEDLSLDIEYQRFMQAVWPDVAEAKEAKDEPSRSTTPVRQDRKKKITEDSKEQKKGAKKIKLDEDWSQESEVDEEVEKSKKRKKKQYESAMAETDKDKEKLRKRKRSSSTLSSVSSEDDRKKKKIAKKKDAKKKLEKVKRRRLEKKVLKKLKMKKKKKSRDVEKEDTDFEETYEKEPKKKSKKTKKKKARKVNKKTGKKKKRARSSSSSESSSSSSESQSDSDRKGKKTKKKEEEARKKKKTKKKKKKKRNMDSESCQSDELFDVNVLNNIKTEPEPRMLARPIINVNTLQDDFSSTVKIKQEAEEEEREKQTEEKRKEQQEEKRVVETERVDTETETESPKEVHSDKLDANASEIHKLDTSQTHQADTKTSQIHEIDKKTSRIHKVDTKSSETHPLQPSASEIHKSTSASHMQQLNNNSSQIHQSDTNASEMHKQESNVNETHKLASASHMHQLDTTSSEIHQTSANESYKLASATYVHQLDANTSQIHQASANDTHMLTTTSHLQDAGTSQIHQLHTNTSKNEFYTGSKKTRRDKSASKMYQMGTNATEMHVHRLYMGQEQDFSADIDVDAETSFKPLPPLPPLPHERDSAIAPAAYEGDGTIPLPYDGQMTYAKTSVEEYEQDNYDMYEQLAMAYQSDVAKQISLPSVAAGSGYAPALVAVPVTVTQRIETVVRGRVRGEIKCDWRPGVEPAAGSTGGGDRPSRWGLKPCEVNIVLTGGGEETEPAAPALPPAPAVETATEPAGRRADPRARLDPDPAAGQRIPALGELHCTPEPSTGYDEAYEVTYGESDRLQYGRCFGDGRRSLDDRIDIVLGEIAKDSNEDVAEKMTKSGRPVKRVSFADGYKPGQDSDVEEPPKKRKRPLRVGCAWPCPVEHVDHVPLWDALPPPPPPPGSPPPPPPPAHQPPLHLLRQRPPAYRHGSVLPPLPPPHPYDPSHQMSKFMPPEPPPGLISFT